MGDRLCDKSMSLEQIEPARPPAWIHTASRIVFHTVARVEEAFEIRAMPEEKWRRKGHEFVRLYVVILRNGAVVAEILHTAIFQPRKAQ